MERPHGFCFMVIFVVMMQIAVIALPGMQSVAGQSGNVGSPETSKLPPPTPKIASSSGTFSLTLDSGEVLITSAVSDLSNGYAYFGTNTSPGRVIKVRLSDFSRAFGVTLGTGQDELVAATIDPVAGYAYFGTYATSPGMIVKFGVDNGPSYLPLIKR